MENLYSLVDSVFLFNLFDFSHLGSLQQTSSLGNFKPVIRGSQSNYFLLAKGPFFRFTIPLYVYRHLYCNRHTL
jgi:hypothetical protein